VEDRIVHELNPVDIALELKKIDNHGKGENKTWKNAKMQH
jgi:hypothetical protein